MSVSQEASLKILNSNVDFQDVLYTNSSGGNSYKFFVPRDIDICSIELTITKLCDDCIDVIILVQSDSLPTQKSFLHNSIILSNQTGKSVFEFYPHENSWHYIDLKFLVKSHPNDSGSTLNPPLSNTSFPSGSNYGKQTKSAETSNSSTVQSIEYKIALHFFDNNENDEDFNESMLKNYEKIKVDHFSKESDYTKYMPLIPKKRNFVEYPLLRQTYREFFVYDFELFPDTNGTIPAYINLTSGQPVLMKFQIGDVYDIGGTLSFAISMKTDGIALGPNVKNSQPLDHRLGDESVEHAIAEKLTSDELKPNVGNQTVIICLRLNEPGIPTWPDKKCVYGRQSFPANSIINNTDPITSTGLIHVAFPETVILI